MNWSLQNLASLLFFLGSSVFCWEVDLTNLLDFSKSSCAGFCCFKFASKFQALRCLPWTLELSCSDHSYSNCFLVVSDLSMILIHFSFNDNFTMFLANFVRSLGYVYYEFFHDNLFTSCFQNHWIANLQRRNFFQLFQEPFH